MDVRGHVQEHAADVRVLDDGDLGPVGAPVFVMLALEALLRVGQGRLVGRRRDGHSLKAHLVAGFVHHEEHERHTLQLLAEQEALAAAVATENQAARWRAVHAQLVLDVPAAHVVRLAQAPVRVDVDLGDDEEAEALRPRRCVGVLARTAWMMLGVKSCSPFVMKIFSPEIL